MFKDYYQVLGIAPSASYQEVKAAYRALSLKWHPDRNPNVEVTSVMQDINEAYSILGNEERRKRYDREYSKFRSETKEKQQQSWNYSYDVHDDELREDIAQAHQQAKDFVDQFFKDLHASNKRAAKGAWEAVLGWIVSILVLNIIFLVLYLVFSAF